MTVTINEIARRAGVAKSTVSRVLNEHPNVSEDTKKKVLRVVKEMDYTGNYFARRIRRDSSGAIGVVFHGDRGALAADPFYNRVFNGIVSAASNKGYSITYIVLAVEKDNSWNHLRELSRGKALDGYIVMGNGYALFREVVEDDEQPVVVVDAFDDGNKWPSVVVDNLYGAREAVKHLALAGFQKISFIYGIDVWGITQSFLERQMGYRMAIQMLGLEYNEDWILGEKLGKGQEENCIRVGYECAERAMQLQDTPTGVFAANDLIAIGVVKSLVEMGYRVPEDVGVIGFDNIPMSRYYHPSLTTISVNKEKMGATAFRRLIQLMNGSESEDLLTKMVLPVELIVRESTARQGVNSTE